MKAQDLMFGDYVMSYDKIYKVVGIECIKGEYPKVEIEREGERYWTSESELHPIFISKEILLDNGFRKTECSYLWGENLDNYIRIWDNQITFINKENRGGVCSMPIYLYELQHLLRFFGFAELANNIKF